MMFAIHDGEQPFEELFRRGCSHGHLPVLPEPALLSATRMAKIPQDLRSGPAMTPLTLQNPDDILNMLADIALRGAGFTTDCLMDYVLEEGFTEPIYLNASGEDPDAYYKGQPNAWAIYQVREWKRVLTVSGGPGKERRVQITETP